MTALYRQYRPQTFAEIIGQEHVVVTLSNQLSSQTLGHAYLFFGPRGVGKTSVARILARAANCLNPKGHEPDNNCLNCQEMLAGSNLDFIEIDAASHTGVDNIREIIEHLPLPPSRGKLRVFIIDEVHMLSRGAFNAILKTLEEPPSHALFILATTEIHKVPATVISRTQRFDFYKLTEKQIKSHLQKVIVEQQIKLDDNIISSIAQSVDGSMRDAFVLLEKAAALIGDKVIDPLYVSRLLGITPLNLRQNFLETILNGELKKAFDFLAKLSDQGFNLEQFNRDFLDHMRRKLSESSDPKLASISENFITAYGQLKITPVPELPLMVAVIKSVGASKSLNPPDGESLIRSQTDDKVSVTDKTEHIEVEQVLGRWDDILTRVRGYNQSLLTALKLAEPTGTLNGSLTIAFPYKFHAETVSAAKNRLVIERVLEEIFGRKVLVKCVLKRNDVTADKPNGKSDLVGAALDILGGEVLD